MSGPRLGQPRPEDRLRVRMVPASHAYVASLLPVDGRARVVHLPDPPVPGAPAGQWWPHPALEPAWVRAHAPEQDVVHSHFGLEGRTVAQLEAWLDALARARLPLVHTVHDLVNPHLRDQTRHRQHLALLVERADALLTLTEGAAREVRRTYGRQPLVVPHPHVVPLARVGARPGPVTRQGPLRVGLHLKSLRANLAPGRVLPALLEAVRRADEALPQGARLEVRAHPEAVEPAALSGDPALGAVLARLRDDPPRGVRLVVAPRLDDDALWTYLEGLDVSVLPYAWGTHSGWVEACRDLGTWALAPDVGHLREQGGVLSWGPAGEPPRAARLADLLLRAARSAPPRVTRRERERQRQDVATTHAEVYAAVVAGERVECDGRVA